MEKQHLPLRMKRSDGKAPPQQAVGLIQWLIRLNCYISLLFLAGTDSKLMPQFQNEPYFIHRALQLFQPVTEKV